MVRKGIITQLFPERTGINSITQKQYVFTPILFEWEEDAGRLQMEHHSLLINIVGSKNKDRIKLAIENRESVPVSIYFDVRSFKKAGETKENYFNSVKGYLNKDFDLTF